jgi:hypothetical protein
VQRGANTNARMRCWQVVFISPLKKGLWASTPTEKTLPCGLRGGLSAWSVLLPFQHEKRGTPFRTAWAIGAAAAQMPGHSRFWGRSSLSGRGITS